MYRSQTDPEIKLSGTGSATCQ